MIPRLMQWTEGRSERLRPLVQDVVLTGMSVVVVVVIAGVIFMPPGMSMAVESTAQGVSASTMVLYGDVVDTSDKPVRAASIVVQRDDTGQQVAATSSAADGTFRVELPPVAATYRIVAAADTGGRNVRDSIRLAMAPGLSYGLRVELKSRDYFLFIVMPSY